MLSVRHRLSFVLCPLLALGTFSASALQIVLPPECGEKAHRIAARELARYWQEIFCRPAADEGRARRVSDEVGRGRS